MSIIERITARPMRAQARRAASDFAGANIGRLTESLTTRNNTINQDLYRNLRVLRARSRQLVKNNEFAKHFMTMVKTNVVGHTGMNLQVHALRSNGEIDEADSAACEAMFKRWAKRGNCDVTGELSFRDLENQYIRTVARDGEVLARRVRGRGFGPFGYQLQMLDPALLDEDYNENLPNGNKVRMSVEFDGWRRPVACWLLEDQSLDVYGTGTWHKNRIRIPASEIWHRFIADDITQARGIPWMHAAILRLNNIGEFEQSAMIAARLGANNPGFFTNKDGELGSLADSESNPGSENSEMQMESEPGVFRSLPNGMGFEQYKSDYPHPMYADFIKAATRGTAVGVDVSYATFASDLSDANMSSMRVGLREEREHWKSIQNWMISGFEALIYSELLPNALMSGEVPELPFSKLAKFDAAVWQGRRWPFDDPAKDVGAAREAIEEGLTSRTRVIREQGGDPEEIWRELEAEEKRLAFKRKTESKPKPKPKAKPDPADEEVDEDETED